ncbi:hypothetical protein EYF80_033176 [Liparis tanakae]|uniref:Uncharacterized protein n=1 Tax=Liparis tanakae TaxID=230148 RepID=A0A4Z2GTB7_9TELE|nr:hypothetical protein EYF80_033176 [Liparis tanakae]
MTMTLRRLHTALWGIERCVCFPHPEAERQQLQQHLRREEAGDDDETHKDVHHEEGDDDDVDDEEDGDLHSTHAGQPSKVETVKSAIIPISTLSNPLALLMALRGLSTRRTRRIFTTEMALELQEQTGIESHVSHGDRGV